MSAVPFDTLKLADRLQAGGFTPEQARTVASALADVASSADLGTKADVLALPVDVQNLAADIQNLAAATKGDLAALETRLEQRLVNRMGAMFIVAVGVVLAAIRYLPAAPHP
jgi:hypothetical protein